MPCLINIRIQNNDEDVHIVDATNDTVDDDSMLKSGL